MADHWFQGHVFSEILPRKYIGLANEIQDLLPVFRLATLCTNLMPSKCPYLILFPLRPPFAGINSLLGLYVQITSDCVWSMLAGSRALSQLGPISWWHVRCKLKLLCYIFGIQACRMKSKSLHIERHRCLSLFSHEDVSKVIATEISENAAKILKPPIRNAIIFEKLTQQFQI